MTQRLLVWSGFCIWAISVLLVAGNVTGLFRTFPYAGAALGMVGSSLVSRGFGLRERATTATEERGYSVITLVFVGALMVASWLWLAATFSTTGQPRGGVIGGLAVTVFFNAVFVVAFAEAVAIARAKREKAVQQP